jgi:two-component system, NarL family, nitrate/nitrite response regulator NarL
MELRCLIVDDSPHFLSAARGLLEREGMLVVAVASTGDEAVRLAMELSPDVTLVDIDLGGESGFDVVRRLTRETALAPGTVILVSTHAEEDYAERISASPVAGFCPRPGCPSRPSATCWGSRPDGAPSGQRASRYVTTASTRR